MAAFLVRRILFLVPVLFFVALMTFVLMHITPGGPWDREKPLSPQAVANLNAKYHLDLPPPEQFLLYLWNALHGDFGPSYTHPGQTVSDIIKSGLGITVQLGAFAFMFAILLGLPLGIVAALKHNTLGDYASMFVAVVGCSVPNFVLATFAIVLFAAVWHLLPTGGWDGWRAWILPSVALGLGPAAAIARYTRSSMLDVVQQDYVRTARAKGVRELLLIRRHEVKNALLPVVTIVGPTVAYLVTGSFVVEEIFHIPGMGRNFVDSILARDYPMIMASVLLYATAVAVANLLVDLSYAFLDPRIRC
ncbi:MAG TPA: ABC transporter permease [Chloroflexota bacterium]|nr:ABC transporter permease [Chloroflexota bacterium]